MRELYLHAANNQGVISRAEAKTLGLSDQQISRRVAAGHLLHLAPSVYGIAGTPDSWLRTAKVATLTTGGLLSHRSAAFLHGIEDKSPSKIEVVVPKTRQPRTPGVHIHRTTQFGLIRPETIDGVPITDVPRTILDLGAVVSLRRVERAIDATLRQGLCEWYELLEVLVRHSIQGRNGCGPLRAIVDGRSEGAAIPDSAWNRMVGQLLCAAGLPTPEYEHNIQSPLGRFVGRVDLAYPARRLAIELDSVRWHLNRESFERDPRRKNDLTLAGWTVLTFTYADYAHRAPQLVNTVRAALSA